MRETIPLSPVDVSDPMLTPGFLHVSDQNISLYNISVPL